MPGSGRTLTGLYTNKGERQRDFGRITGKPEVAPPIQQTAPDKTLPISAKWFQMLD